MRYLVSLAATLLLHWLLLQPLLLGSATAKRSPAANSGPGAISSSSNDGESMTLVLVYLPTNHEASLIRAVSSVGVAPADSIVQIASTDPLPLLEFEHSDDNEELGEAARAAGDPAVQAMLFGRYTAQIDARIERAWRRPRSPVSAQASEFHCQARISQDAVGNVTEVELMQCEGSTAWQFSLVRAIQRASPLPAPPSPTVFTNALTLAFEAKAYEPGYREDEYEPLTIRSAQADLGR